MNSNHNQRVLDNIRNKRQIEQLLSLVKKSIIASEKYSVYEVDMNYTCSSFFEFRIYRRGENADILMWETVRIGASDFDDKFKALDMVLNHLLRHGVMPDIYNFYLNNDNDNQLG